MESNENGCKLRNKNNKKVNRTHALMELCYEKIILKIVLKSPNSFQINLRLFLCFYYMPLKKVLES